MKELYHFIHDSTQNVGVHAISTPFEKGNTNIAHVPSWPSLDTRGIEIVKILDTENISIEDFKATPKFIDVRKS